MPAGASLMGLLGAFSAAVQRGAIRCALVLVGIVLPASATAGGAYHACAFDCRGQGVECIDAVRGVLGDARRACAGDPAPRLCRREARRTARLLRRSCSTGKLECERCCRACLDAAVRGEGGECPGFGIVGQRACWVTVCGDRRVTGTEACDDGNAVEGDGCAPGCSARVY
jgi:cysteine-rich repeat protein